MDMSVHGGENINCDKHGIGYEEFTNTEIIPKVLNPIET